MGLTEQGKWETHSSIKLQLEYRSRCKNGHEQRDDGDDDVDGFCTQKEYPGKMLSGTSEPGRLSAGLS